MLHNLRAALAAVLVIPVYLFSACLLLSAELLMRVAAWFMHGDIVAGAFLFRFRDDWILSGVGIRARAYPTFDAASMAMTFAISDQVTKAIDKYSRCSECRAVLAPGNSRSGHPGVCCFCAHLGRGHHA
jgi:hypothetical protein